MKVGLHDDFILKNVFTFKTKVFVEYNFLSNIIPRDVKLPSCDWNLVVRV